MKRTPLKRKTWMRRQSVRMLSGERKAKRKSKYKLRPRDTEYMLWIKQQMCCARSASDCDGPVEADHAGRRGMSRKSGDRTCIPLCTLHHAQRGSFSGVFRTWNQEMMRAWLEGHVLAYHEQFNQEMTMNEMTDTKRFFKFDDGGALFYVVANDAERAKRLLMDTGIEFGYPSSPVPPDPIEITMEQAAKIRCDMSDAPGCDPGTKCQLSECAVGDWFSTEW